MIVKDATPLRRVHVAGETAPPMLSLIWPSLSLDAGPCQDMQTIFVQGWSAPFRVDPKSANFPCFA